MPPFPFPCPYQLAPNNTVLGDDVATAHKAAHGVDSGGAVESDNATPTTVFVTACGSPSTKGEGPSHQDNEHQCRSNAAPDMDCTVLSEPCPETVVDGVLRWCLCNSGSAAWPEGTVLRCVGISGDLAGSTRLENSEETAVVLVGGLLGSVAPGKHASAEMPLGLHRRIVAADEDSVASLCQVRRYALITPDGRLFGPLLAVWFIPAPLPMCAVIVSPGSGYPVEASEGELMTLEWWLANSGTEAWPNDFMLVLLEKSSGLQLGADVASMCLPLAPPQVTVQLSVPAVMPSRTGRFIARWAIRTPTFPAYEEKLFVEFYVGGWLPSPLGIDVAVVQEHKVPVPTTTQQQPVVQAAPLLPEAPLPQLADALLFTNALQRITYCEDMVRREACYATLIKVFRNIQSAPLDPKFRRIPLASRKLASDVLAIPGGRDVLLGVGFVEDGDAFSLPVAVYSVEAALIELRAVAEKVALDRKRHERDAKIDIEKEKAKKKSMGKGRKLDKDMLETLAKVKDDQEILTKYYTNE